MSVIENTPNGWSARARYESALLAVGWTESGQADRFRAVLSHLDLKPGDRLLDFGCGVGSFASFLPANIDYLGYDSAWGMIERAKRDKPAASFVDGYPSGRFEHVVAIGCFNLPQNWSKPHTWHLLRHLWDTTGCRTLIASLYSGTDERCLSYTTDELERAGRNLGADVQVDAHRYNDLLLVACR